MSQRNFSDVHVDALMGVRFLTLDSVEPCVSRSGSTRACVRFGVHPARFRSGYLYLDATFLDARQGLRKVENADAPLLRLRRQVRRVQALSPAPELHPRSALRNRCTAGPSFFERLLQLGLRRTEPARR